MKVVKNSFIPFKGFKCLNLFGIIFTRGTIKDTDLNHEAIHTAQMKEMLYIPFYIWYLIEYIIRLMWSLTHPGYNAYKMVSFEVEAYKYQKDKYYLKHRKRYRWLKYL